MILRSDLICTAFSDGYFTLSFSLSPKAFTYNKINRTGKSCAIVVLNPTLICIIIFSIRICGVSEEEMNV